MADHDTAFSRVKELVTHAVTFAHPKQDYELCLFRDASNFHWGIILTQAPKKQLKVSVHDQEHETLVVLSGSFNATQRRWSIIEKEAFPIMESLDKLRHFLLSDNHFQFFTDRQKLIFLFDPTFKESDFKKQTVDRLCRWASKLQGFRFPGEDNLWQTCCLDGYPILSRLELWLFGRPLHLCLKGISPGFPFLK